MSVNVSQPGARVYINNAYVGEAPLTYIIGIPDSVAVRVEKEGYMPWEEHVDVPLNVIVQLKVTLTPVKPSETEPPKQTEIQGVESKEKPVDGRLASAVQV